MSLRVVLDTNIVLSAMLFSSGRVAWIRHAWQQGALIPLVCKPTVEELLRVLAYPKFRLSPQEREELLAEFLPHAQSVTLPQRWPELPACRDAKDQVFLVLAHHARADALVTGDADLLAMQGALPFPIVSAEAFLAQINE